MRSFRTAVPVILLMVSHTPTVSAAPEAVASWSFDEGEGKVLVDRSGNGNHGDIHGARWIVSGTGYALEFDGVDDYVDCGDGSALNLTGPTTLEAWIRPSAANRGEPGIAGKFFSRYAFTYYGSAYFYIGSGGNNVRGPTEIGAWTHIAGTFDGAEMKFYVDGLEVQAKESAYREIPEDGRFRIGCVLPPESTGPPEPNTKFFPGAIDEVRLFDHALDRVEVAKSYNRLAREKGREPLDADRFERVALEPFFYPRENKAVVSANYRWFAPIGEEAEFRANLFAAGTSIPLATRTLATDDPRWEAEAEFALDGIPEGRYEIRTVLDKPGEAPSLSDTIRFDMPLPGPAPPPMPSEFVVDPSPEPSGSLEYAITVLDHGGLRLRVEDQTYDVESTFSYPDGGFNALSSERFPEAEPDWKVERQADEEGNTVLLAEGAFYRLTRTLSEEPTRVLVRDTFSNFTDDVLGVLVSNRIRTDNLVPVDDVETVLMMNPSIYVGAGKNGLGLLALDDLYQLQQSSAKGESFVELRDDHFGLDAGVSYTMEWALYPTARSDYFEFVNRVRQEEGLNRRVEGAFGFVDRREPPDKQLVDLKNLRYTSIGCLGAPADDPTVSLEGYEFPSYPRESELLAQTLKGTKEKHPGTRVMLHVAHSLYATGDPEELFPDSRALDENGNQVHYGPNSMDYYGRYFSEDRVNDGWRWWIFYPTLENAFGKAMLKATVFMLEEMGATGMWADGFISGYVPGGYTYDRWDGHSVTIDPETKRVVRKKGNVTYLALPVLREVSSKIAAEGGTLISNGKPGPRSTWKDPVLSSCETAGGDQKHISALYFGPSITPLGSPTTIKNERDIHRDILAKLDLGALYFWYGEGSLLTRPTMVENMYPITPVSIRPGTIEGEERIVTRKSGVYGWPDDRSLHKVFRYDARGLAVAPEAVTTLDDFGTRTQIDLGEDEAAVIQRMPIELKADGPVNVRVEEYTAENAVLSLSGEGPVEVVLRPGDFEIRDGVNYKIHGNGKERSITATGDDLKIRFDLKGFSVRMRIEQP